MHFEEITTETSLNEESDINSKREMIFKSYYPSMFNLENKPKSNKSNKKRINNIDSNNIKSNKNKNIIGSSLYHESIKKKKNNDLIKSSGEAFGVLKLGLINKKREEDIILSKKEINKKREERSSKSIKKSKNKNRSINYYHINEKAKSNNSPSNKKENVYNINNIINNKINEYLGEKITIDINNLNLVINKFKKSNNISNFKNENTYEKRQRISCIINNSPFINSNIFLNNKSCITSMEPLLGKDKCRFFEKNKNEYKNNTINEILKNIPENIFQEVDSELNEKLYELDPSKISIGQIYKKDKRYIRNITNLDGNSFLKAFLYNYLEQIISRKDMNKLKEIIGRIKAGLKSLKINRNIIDEVLSHFKIIVNYLEKDDIINANNILIKSFSENYDFEKNLMIYMRQSLAESIKRHQCYFIIDYIKEIVSKKYIKIDGNNNEVFDYELYIKEVIDIDSNNNELQYELLLYYFLPPIFGIDLIIHTDNNTKTNKIIFKHSNNLNEKKDIIVIELLLKFGNVSILYSEDYYNKYENIIPLKNNNEFPLDKIRIIKNEENKNCYMCHEIPNEFIQIDYKFQLICKKCLNEIIQKIIEKRYFLFSDTDSYFHEEYYCNKINYVINENLIDSYDLNISINDIKYISNNNLDISSQFYNKIIKSYKCEKCENNFENSLYCYIMDTCCHLICSNCLKDYIYKATEEKVVFNVYENIIKKMEYFCPLCNKNINLSKNLINNLFNDDVYMNKAEERLIHSAKTICSFCGENDDKKIKNKFVIENDSISSNYSKENYLLIHSLCINCFKKLKQNDLNDNKKKFFCKFCGENHHYNKVKFSIQKRKKACCIHI